MLQRRRFFAVSAAGLCPALLRAQSPGAGAPLRIVVPFAKGGGSDVATRLLAEPLGRALGQAVVVDNIAGAGGSTGMATVARAEPDGLTFGLATVSTHGVNPAVYKALPYDALRDFEPVSELVRAPGMLAVNASLPVRDTAEFVRYLKKQPGQLVYGSPGIGTVGHMWGELFKSTTGTSMAHAPYGTPGVAGNVGEGRLAAYFDQIAPLLPHIRSGKLRALAVSWSGRLESLPDVPTYAEMALFSNNDPSWFGLVAPVGTPAVLVRKVQQAAVRALADPALRAKLLEQGLFASGNTPYEFAAQIRREVDKMQRINRFARISLSV